MRAQISKFALVTLIVSLLVALFNSSPAQANAETRELNPCEDNYVKFNGYKIQTMQVRGPSNECLIYVSQSNSVSDSYKRLIWNSNGEFGVFYSFGSGSEKSQTGMQNYYFFPKLNDLKLTLIGSDIISVTTASGVEMRFNTTLDLFESIEGVEYTQNSNYTLASADWLTLISTEGYIFASTFARGRSPKDDPNGNVRILNPAYTCKTTHRDLFLYSAGEPSIKIKSSADLAALLGKPCKFSGL